MEDEALRPRRQPGRGTVLRRTSRVRLVNYKTRRNDTEARWRFAAMVEASPGHVEGGKKECEAIFVDWEHN